MKLIYSFIAIIFGAAEGAGKAIEKSYEESGAIPVSCAVIALLGITFSILDKDDPSWSLVIVPFGIYAILTAGKAVLDKIYGD